MYKCIYVGRGEINLNPNILYTYNINYALHNVHYMVKKECKRSYDSYICKKKCITCGKCLKKI